MTSHSEPEKVHPGYEKFMAAAGSNLDEVTMILRTHLLAEYYLNHIIMAQMARGDILTESRISFSQKIIIVEALNVVRKKLIDSLKRLNKVRNDCTHSLDYKITESDVDKIGGPFGQDYLDIKKRHLRSTKELLHWTLALPIIHLQVATGKDLIKDDLKNEKDS